MERLANFYRQIISQNMILKFYFFNFIYIEYLCSTCMPRIRRGQKRALDTLRLELQEVVSYQMDG